MTTVADCELSTKLSLLREYIKKKANCMRDCLYNHYNGNGEACECCQPLVTEFESKQVDFEQTYKLLE